MNNKKIILRLFRLVLILSFIFIQFSLIAADYIVMGRVYNAYQIEEGEDIPANPLSQIPASDIVGGIDLVAVEEYNLANVKIVSASTGAELANYITRNSGNYFIYFTHPNPATLQVKIIVQDMITSEIMTETEEITIYAFTNINTKYVLVEKKFRRG